MTKLCRWLKTENGQNFADAVGVEEAPMEVNVAVGKIMEQVSTIHRVLSLYGENSL